MKKAFMPMFTCPAVVSGGKSLFYTSREKVTMVAPASLMRELVALCDGRHTTEQVVECLAVEWDGSTVQKLMEALCEKGVIVSSQHLWEEMWKNIRNPSQYPNTAVSAEVAAELAQKARERHEQNPTPVVYAAQPGTHSNLLTRRQSTRMFTGGQIGFQSLINVLWGSYGLCEPLEDGNSHRTVASAGGLYPLTIHIALFQQSGDLEPGIYRLYLGSPGSVGFHLVSNDILCFLRAFIVNPNMLQKAHGVIVVSGSFDISGEKYGNRSMIYASLEAGSVAQNIHLSAIENGVGTVEIGGFMELPMSGALGLPESYHPLTTIAFGIRDDGSMVEDMSHIEFQWAMPVNDTYRPPFTIVSARLSPKRSWSHGRDASPVVANVKAISEAKEWMSCGCVPKLRKERFVDLESAVDPRDVIKFHPSQYRLRRFPFRPFDELATYEWAEGRNERTGDQKHILADLVYFPYFPESGYYCYANSSGVAAYPDKQKAVEIATLELVERDAFMLAYLARLELPTIERQTLPGPILTRIRDLERVGFQVTVKDHTIDLVPVACVIAQSEVLGYTACASCSKFNMEQAIGHALMEAEAFVLARFEKGIAEHIKPSEVEMPNDHGKLYDQRRYFHRADFLTYGSEIPFTSAGQAAVSSWEELLDRFRQKGWELFTVPLRLAEEYGGNGDLYIVRAIVPGMVPMTFGYRQEPAGMSRIYQIAKEHGNSNLSYGELTKFPHPFA